MKKILVIDDEPIVRISYERTLAPEGYEVRIASSGKEGLEILERESFDLTLLDLKMPGIDGIEVLKRILKKWPDAKVIISTGYSTTETAEEALRCGACDHITKPFTPDSLLAAVNKVIGK